ncbi:hypothetical protein Tco_1153892 [Tanacetum coccineum]
MITGARDFRYEGTLYSVGSGIWAVRSFVLGAAVTPREGCVIGVGQQGGQVGDSYEWAVERLLTGGTRPLLCYSPVSLLICGGVVRELTRIGSGVRSSRVSRIYGSVKALDVSNARRTRWAARGKDQQGNDSARSWGGLGVKVQHPETTLLETASSPAKAVGWGRSGANHCQSESLQCFCELELLIWGGEEWSRAAHEGLILDRYAQKG